MSERLARKNDTVASSNEVRKAKAAPVARAGRMPGRVTSQMARAREAPRFIAASSRLGSERYRAADTMITTYGLASAVCASTNPWNVPAMRSCEKKSSTAMA